MGKPTSVSRETPHDTIERVAKKAAMEAIRRGAPRRQLKRGESGPWIDRRVLDALDDALGREATPFQRGYLWMAISANLAGRAEVFR